MEQNIDKLFFTLIWYSDSVGKIFNVYNYDRNSYTLIGKDFGFLINKSNAVLI